MECLLSVGNVVGVLDILVNKIVIRFYGLYFLGVEDK